MTELNSTKQTPSLFQHGTLTHHQRWRLIKDNVAGKGVIIGGLSVIVAIVLIFFYLLYVVFPLFGSAEAAAASDLQEAASDLQACPLVHHRYSGSVRSAPQAEPEGLYVRRGGGH